MYKYAAKIKFFFVFIKTIIIFAFKIYRKIFILKLYLKILSSADNNHHSYLSIVERLKAWLNFPKFIHTRNVVFTMCGFFMSNYLKTKMPMIKK